MSKKTIVIADDHVLIRDGIKSLIQSKLDVEIVGEASNGQEAIDCILATVPDIAVLDLNMPIKNGIEVIKEVRAVNPLIRCIVLSMHEDPEYVIKSVQAGAMSYVIKNSDHQEILNAVKAVSLGQKYFNSNISSILIQGLSQQTADTINYGELLTPREKEVLKEVVNGLSTKMIADKLSIGSRTVETHRINIMKKMQVQNTAELVRKTIENKIFNH
jgi:DNA-binding NarL/FixJ family response regulator